MTFVALKDSKFHDIEAGFPFVKCMALYEASPILVSNSAKSFIYWCEYSNRSLSGLKFNLARPSDRARLWIGLSRVPRRRNERRKREEDRGRSVS